MQAKVAVLDREALGDAGLHGQRSATGTIGRQLAAECRQAGQGTPFIALPADHARLFATAFNLDQGRYGFDVQPIGGFQRAVVDDAAGRRKVQLVLHVDGQRQATAFDSVQDRVDQHAGRAILFDDGDQTFRQLHQFFPLMRTWRSPEHSAQTPGTEVWCAPAMRLPAIIFYI